MFYRCHIKRLHPYLVLTIPNLTQQTILPHVSPSDPHRTSNPWILKRIFFDPCLLWPRPGQDELLSWNLSILCHSKKSWGKKTNCLLSKVLPEIASKGQKVEDSADRMRIFSNLFKVKNLTRRGEGGRIESNICGKYNPQILKNCLEIYTTINKSNSLRNGPPKKHTRKYQNHNMS